MGTRLIENVCWCVQLSKNNSIYLPFPPTTVEELTARSDKNAQHSPAGDRTPRSSDCRSDALTTEQRRQLSERREFARNPCRDFVAQWLERATGDWKAVRFDPWRGCAVFFRLVELSVLLPLSEKREENLTSSYFVLQAEAGAFFTVFGISMAMMDTGYSASTVFSLLAPTIELATLLILAPSLIWFTFGGVFIRPGQAWIGIRWLEQTSFILFSFKAIMVTEFEGLTFNCTQLLPCAPTYDVIEYENVIFNFSQVAQDDQCVVMPCQYPDGAAVLSSVDVNLSIGEYTAIVVGMDFFYKLLSTFLLKYVRVGGV